MVYNKRFLLIALAIFSASFREVARGAEARSEGTGLLLEIKAPGVEVRAGEELVAIFTLINNSSASCNERIPFKWHSKVWNWFEVYHNETKLNSPWEGDYLFKESCLAPGERVTIAFKLSEISELPPVQKDRTGCYLVRPKSVNAYLQTAIPVLVVSPMVFWVVDKPADRLGIKQIANEEDLEKARVLINLSSLYPVDRLSLLKMAVAYGRREALWRLIGRCDEPYALVTILEELPASLLDKEGLFKLLPAKDLSIRRAAIRALARPGKDEEAAKRLEEFLNSQKDEPTLDYGRAVIEVLNGRQSALEPALKEVENQKWIKAREEAAKRPPPPPPPEPKKPREPSEEEKRAEQERMEFLKKLDEAEAKMKKGIREKK